MEKLIFAHFGFDYQLLWLSESAGFLAGGPDRFRVIDQGRTGDHFIEKGYQFSGLVILYVRAQWRRLLPVRDCFSLDTPSGRHFARMMASQAEYDNEVRSENIRAGQAVARKQGKRWGGSEKGKRKKVTSTQARFIKRMKEEGESIVSIAKAVKLSRPTIYDVLRV